MVDIAAKVGDSLNSALHIECYRTSSLGVCSNRSQNL